MLWSWFNINVLQYRLLRRDSLICICSLLWNWFYINVLLYRLLRRDSLIFICSLLWNCFNNIGHCRRNIWQNHLRIKKERSCPNRLLLFSLLLFINLLLHLYICTAGLNGDCFHLESIHSFKFLIKVKLSTVYCQQKITELPLLISGHVCLYSRLLAIYLFCSSFKADCLFFGIIQHCLSSI